MTNAVWDVFLLAVGFANGVIWAPALAEHFELYLRYVHQ